MAQSAPASDPVLVNGAAMLPLAAKSAGDELIARLTKQDADRDTVKANARAVLRDAPLRTSHAWWGHLCAHVNIAAPDGWRDEKHAAHFWHTQLISEDEFKARIAHCSIADPPAEGEAAAPPFGTAREWAQRELAPPQRVELVEVEIVQPSRRRAPPLGPPYRPDPVRSRAAVVDRKAARH